MALSRGNKRAYAQRHGYALIDASVLRNFSRPASWSKILAVRSHLARFDWVFWVDADTMVTNPAAQLEALLPAASTADLVITKDAADYNAGVWLLRNSPWSFAFLDRWWSLDRFVRQRPGDRKSGDNDALIHLLSELREAAPEEYRAHVFEAPQCAFNSYLWRSSARNWWRLLTRRQITLNGLYQPGDFLLHLAGQSNARKVAAIRHHVAAAGAQAA